MYVHAQMVSVISTMIVSKCVPILLHLRSRLIQASEWIKDDLEWRGSYVRVCVRTYVAHFLLLKKK